VTKAHQWRIACLGWLVLAFSIAIPSLAGIGRAADDPAQGWDLPTGPRPGHPVSPLSGSPHITITAAGFDPAVLTVPVGIEVTWTNGTDVTHVLQSGVPCHVFLPVVLKTWGGGSGLAAESTAPTPRTTALTLASSESFSATLPPGGTFTHTFTSFGEHPYFLATGPQFSGRVIVPGITGGQKPVTPVYQPPLDDPVGLAVNSAETVAYVAEKGADRLVAVDIDPASPTCRAITPIATGLEDLQMGLALDPTETYAYVVENEPGTLKRVTLASGQVVTIATGLHYPHDVVLNSDGTLAYVTVDPDALVRVTIATGQVHTVTANLYHPAGLALLPGGAEALVDEPGGQLQRVDLATGATAGFDAGFMPYSIALDADGNKAYLGYYASSDLRIVDVATGHTERVERLPFRTFDIVVGPSNTHAYVLWRWLGQIAVLSLDTWEATPVFEVLDHPTGVALNPVETHAYVLEQETGELSRIGLAPASPDYGRPVRVASVRPWDSRGGSLALSADETWALAIKDSHDEPTLLRVNLATGLTSTVTSFALGPLRGVALSPDERCAYVTGDTTVKRVDLATGDVSQVGDRDAYRWGLNGAALSADGNRLYVAQRDLNRLFEVDVTTGAVVTVTSDLHLPVAVALAPGETTAWVLEEGRGGTLAQVDLASSELLADTPLQPWITFHGMPEFATGWTGNLALSADGTTAYVPMAADGQRYLYRVDLTGQANVRALHVPPMLDLQDVALNQAETRAYLLDRSSSTLFQLDMDPASPTSGTLSALVDGRLSLGRQVALSSDEATLVVAYDGGLMQIRVSDGVVLKDQWIGPFGTNGLALHPAQPIAYVTTHDGSLREVDLNAEEDSTLIAGGLDDPTGVVLNGAGTIAYVVERNAGRLVTVTLSTGVVDTVATGLPPSRDVALDEVDGVAYVLGDDVEDNPRVVRVDLDTGAVEWACSGAYGGAATAAIVLGQDRQHLYVARQTTGGLWRIDLAQAAAAAIPPSSAPHPVSYHPEPVYEEMERQQGGTLGPDGQRLYLGDEFTPRVVRLDLAAGRVRWVAGLEWPNFGMAVAPDESILYNTRMYADGLEAVDLETGTTQVVYTGDVDGLVLDPTDPDLAYGTNNDGEVFRLNLTDGTRTVLPIQLENHMAAPQTLAINAAGTCLYIVPQFVGELGDYTVVRFDLGTGEATTVAVVDSQGDWPGTIIVDGAERYAYVSELGWGGTYGGTRGGAVRRVDVDPVSPTYSQVQVVVPDVGEIFPLALDPTGDRLIVGGGGAYVIFEID
jgi:DNA-binding beta-propeller fold protein YncE